VERLGSQLSADPATRAAQKQQIAASIEQMHPMQATLAALAQGEDAAALLADRQNIAAAQKAVELSGQAPRPEFRDAVEQAKKSIATDAAAMGLNPSANDFDAQLQQRIAAAKQAQAAQAAPDVVALTKQWASASSADRSQMSPDTRLSLLAQAEALRPDAQFVWARDLQLASHAIQRVGESQSATQPSAQKEQTIVSALETLAQAHVASNGAISPPSTPQADAARDTLRQLAGEDETPGTFGRNENATMDASAAAVSKRYDAARQIDRNGTGDETGVATTEPANSSGSAEQSLGAAQQLDALQAQEKSLAAETGANQDDPQALARQQDALADQIEEIRRQRSPELGEDNAGDFNSRNKAMAAVRAMQQRAAALPQQFAEARKAGDAARAARAAVASAPARDKADAEAKAQAAERAASEAEKQVDPSVANFMATRLRQFEPETSGALVAIETQLRPAMQSFAEALKSGKSAGADADPAAQAGAQATQQMRSQLLGAHEKLADADPLAAAQWFARQAARALAGDNPQLHEAQVDQSNAAVALGRASDKLARESATARLASLPSMMGLFAPSSPYETAPQNNELLGFLPGLPALRDWTTLRIRPAEELNASSREGDPAGYQDALRVYFAAISKLREGVR
jgi:hypothetical protein